VSGQRHRGWLAVTGAFVGAMIAPTVANASPAKSAQAQSTDAYYPMPGYNTCQAWATSPSWNSSVLGDECLPNADGSYTLHVVWR